MRVRKQVQVLSHQLEANVRSIELALADAIRKANPEHRKLFRNGDAALHALELARQHLKEFYNGSECAGVA